MDGSRSSDDKVFQAAGLDVENARGPKVDVSVLGITNWLSSADRSRDRPKTEEVGTQSLVRYTGACLADTLLLLLLLLLLLNLNVMTTL